jgi:hypothetical protein
VALHERLAAHSYSRAVAAAWRAFYRLTARLHEHRNAEAWKHPLPVVAHNGHQHAARMWIEEFARRGRSLSLLHFDTHADMRPVRRPGEVVRAVAELSGNQREQARGRATLERLIIDHATPVTAGVLGDAAGDVTWATPAWAYAPDFIRRPVQWASVPTTPRGHRLFQMLHDESADPEGPLPVYATRAWDEVSGFPPAARRAMEHVRERRLSYVRTHPLRGDGRRRLQRALGDGAFVMDIDLDYFMSIDSESGFSRRGRGTRTRAAWDAELGRRLREGRRLLDQRLEAFERLLTRLRDAGRIPSLITLADSTYMPFFPTLAGQAYWEYLPREYAGYVHWRVRHLLSDVYREHGVGAGV